MKRRLYHRALRIVGNEWLQTKGRVIKADTVDVVRCGDNFKFMNPPRFPITTRVLFRGCDKNFVHYWLSPKVFSKPEQILLLSHPCDSSTFSRFPDSQIFLHVNAYNFYKNHLFPEYQENIKPITSEQIEHEIIKLNLFHKKLKR